MSPDDLKPLLRILDAGAIALPCRVLPRSSRNAVAGLLGNAVKIALTAPPVDGKANDSLCEFVARKCGLPRRAVSIHSGQTSRNKILRIAAPPDLVLRSLCDESV